jgi:hypothetical protein
VLITPAASANRDTWMARRPVGSKKIGFFCMPGIGSAGAVDRQCARNSLTAA